MRKILFFIYALTIGIIGQVNAQNTNVPDVNFEQALLDLGLDIDLTINGQVATAGINTVTALDISGKNISDLTGIEGFVALQVLNCSNNNLTTLNIDTNQALQQLNCSNNTIGPFINTEFNQNLVVINAANNQLTSFDVEFNTILTDFNISNNNSITNLDLSLLGNLASLNLDNMSALEQLNIANNNNEGITTFSAVNTPKLFCTNVSDVAFTEANWTNRDAQNAYSTSCFYDGFITTWQTDNLGATTSNTIRIPTTGSGYNYAVNWGDGSIETGITANATHTYATPGTYTVQVSGDFPRLYFNATGDRRKIIDIVQWGAIAWTNMEGAFRGCSNLSITATDAPNLLGVTNMAYMFHAAYPLGAINHWQTGTITNMKNLFSGSNFNEDLNGWNVSSVTNMTEMFFGTRYNKDLNNWNVSNVTDMSFMFAESEFNKNINNWVVSNVTNMSNMFADTNDFNQDLSNWNVSNVTNMNSMFNNADAFNQSLATWDVSSVTTINNMLHLSTLSTANYDATLIGWSNLPNLQNGLNFNGGGSTYCNSLNERQHLIDTYGWTITDGGPESVVCRTADFISVWQTDNPGSSNDNQMTIPGIGTYTVYWENINNLNVKGSTVATGTTTLTLPSAGTYRIAISGNLERLYFNATGDRRKIIDIVQWGAIAWTNMEGAFRGCSNLSITATDAPNLSGVTNMAYMFHAAYPLGALNHWETGTITNMKNLFSGSNFNEDLNGWNVSNVTNMTEMFFGTRFNKDLNNWNVNNVTNMSFMFAESKFNKNINNWEVSNVTNMSNMFADTNDFNQDLSNWNVSNVTNMNSMFNNADAFNQSLATWDVSSVTTINNMLHLSTLYTANYDATLIGWSNLTGLQNGLNFNGGGSKYCASIAARQHLIDTYGWTITDGGLESILSCRPTDFISVWQTNNPGTSNNNQITIPGIGNYTVYWENINNLNSNGTTTATGTTTLTFPSAGTYRVAISGGLNRINFDNLGDKNKILNIVQWGNIAWTSMVRAFSGCTNLSITATDAPNLSGVTSMYHMFIGAGTLGAINHWNTTTITNMERLFSGSNFNEDLNGWNVSNVTNMFGLFSGSPFNKPLNNWVVSNVSDMHDMFSYNQFFNQDLSQWNTSAVTNMSSMFNGATAFNQSLAAWDVSNVTNMTNMLNNVTLSAENYDATLIGWNSLSSLQNNINFNGGNAQYCAATTAKQNLINTYNWSITDGGVDAICPSNLDVFSTLWQTTTANETISIPTTGIGYNYTVDWGDGVIDTSVTANATHTYATAGIYKVEISGNFPRLFFNNTGDKDKILSVEQWGNIQWTDMTDAFNGCSNLQINATDAPDLSGVSNMSRTFKDCTTLNASLNHWDVSTIKFMPELFEGASSFNGQIGAWTTTNLDIAREMFKDATSFNQDISGWVMTKAKNMSRMFENAQVFNQPIGNWTLENASNMSDMFNNADAFNQPLHTWNVSTVTQMSRMFFNADSFNENLSGWITSNVTSMNSMFSGAILFNQPINSWNVANVTNMASMFRDANAFNQPLDNWTVQNVTTMNRMFVNTNAFNQNINSWNVENVIDMNGMFEQTQVFNQPLHNWNVTHVTTMESMFKNAQVFNQPVNSWVTTMLTDIRNIFNNAKAFNQPLNNWNVSNVTTMNGAFLKAEKFNQPLSNWNTANVQTMLNMFEHADAFNQSLANWDVGNVTSMEYMFFSVGLSVANYDATLTGWSNLPNLQNNVVFVGGTSQYCYSETARQNIINTYGWNITDQGKNSACPTNFNSFLTTWKTTVNNESITIPTVGSGYNYSVDWGDGIVETGQTGNAIHTYAVAGSYQVEITGAFPRIYFNNSGDKDKIQSVDQWGNIAWSSMANAFYGCTNLLITANDAPDFTNVTATGGMFWEATAMTSGVAHWEMSTITFMTDMFNGATSFNENISNWNVSNVTHMDGMFRGATAFNQDLIWNTNSLRFTRFMFNNASNFNGNITAWQVDALEEMDAMFKDATAFNQDISGWITSNVREMDQAFSGATAFNQNIGGWLVENVTEMQSMFLGATAFNQDLSNWNVGNVLQMQHMFDGATAFNQSLAAWNVSKVINMTEMFSGVTLSLVNYDATLIAWANLPTLENGVTFNGGNSQYCEAEQVRMDVLQNTYNWSITDGGANVITPVAICRNITVELGVTGKVTITPEQVDNGSINGCGLSLSINKSVFTCNDLGDNMVTLTVTNSVGATNTCTAIVTVQDTTAPQIELQDYEVTLDQNGSAIISAEDILRTNGFYAIAKNASGTPLVSLAFFDYETNTDAVNLSQEYDYIPTGNNVYGIDGNPMTGKVYVIASKDPFPNLRFLYQVNIENEEVFPIARIESSTGDDKPVDMTFGLDGTLYMLYRDGVIETFNLDNGQSLPFATIGTTASTQGLTYDFDQNRLLYVKESNPVQLFEINIETGVSSALFNFNAATADGPCSAKAIEYVGNNKLLAGSTITNAVTCDAVYKVDLISQNATVLINPTGTINEIQDILYPWYGDLCAEYTSSINVTEFTCENVGTNNEVVVTLTDASGNSQNTTVNVVVNENPTNPCMVRLSPVAMLQGAAIHPNAGEETLMRDDLRVAGLIPTTSPYADVATCNPAVFNQTGVDAVVDWVWVELRDATNNTIVIDGESGLLTRGGSVFSADGFTPINFKQVSKNYHIVIKHRNHLAVMTNSPLPLSDSSIQVDFTNINNPITFGVNAQTSYGMSAGKVGMWSGNVNGDTSIQYSGTSPDVPLILSFVLNDSGNFLNFPTYEVSGYNVNDVNMDGKIQYSGASPDSPFILQNIFEHPGNFLNFSTYQIQEQLPEN